MGFMSSCDLTIYNVEDPRALNSAKLKKFAFQSIDNAPGEESAQGWANIDNFLDCEWQTSPPEKGEWLTFVWRRDKRNIPASVLKKHLEERIAKYEAQGTKRKKSEVRDEVKTRLLSKADPVPSATDCAVSLKSGLMLVASSSKGSLTEIEGLFSNTFGVAPVQRTTEADVPAMFVDLFREGLRTEYDGASYTISYGDQMTMSGMDGEDQATLTIKNDRATVEHALEADFVIQKIRVTISKDDDEAFTWNCSLKYDQGMLSVHGVKIPVPDGNEEYKDDPDALFVFRMDHFETFVNIISQVFQLR